MVTLIVRIRFPFRSARAAVARVDVRAVRLLGRCGVLACREFVEEALEFLTNESTRLVTAPDEEPSGKRRSTELLLDAVARSIGNGVDSQEVPEGGRSIAVRQLSDPSDRRILGPDFAHDVDDDKALLMLHDDPTRGG